MSMLSVNVQESDDAGIAIDHFDTLTPLAQDGCLLWMLARCQSGESIIIATSQSDDVTFQATQRLKNERALAGYLSPRWAITATGTTRYHNRYALIYPSFPFRTLAHNLATPPEHIADFLQVALQLCYTLGQAHHQGIVHGDIKPGHFFVTDEGRFRLGGFGLASLAAQSADKTSLRASGGTLAYMSPEHTGRTPHPVSSLSDLYSLGVVLYEYLTGRLPFGSPDAGEAEWIHHHIATAPRPADQVRDDVPPMLSVILLRLLAKSPAEGYQTVQGLMADLRRCQATLTAENTIAPFTPGLQERFSSSFRPEMLFTQHPQARALLTTLEAVNRSGTQSLVMLSGAPGSGKSAIIASALKNLQHRQILLAASKADQHSPAAPYAAIASAFRTVTLYLLGLSAPEVSKWRGRLLRLLGGYTDLAIELVPELKQLLNIRTLPPVVRHATDAREQFNQMACALIEAFATPGRPLVMLIDDVHWADNATLQLLETLITRSEHLPFMLVLAFREGESMPCPMIAGFLLRIRESAARLVALTPQPLSVKSIGRWLAGRLHTRPGGHRELAQIIFDKTGGNPLSVQAFFRQAVDDGVIYFRQNPLKWHYDSQALIARQYTDNVATLVLNQLVRMPEITRQLLGDLACLGTSGELSLISHISGTPVTRLQQQLEPAVSGRFITLTGGNYAFTHDRVHNAAFLLPDRRQQQHLHQQAAAWLSDAVMTADNSETLFRAVYHIGMIAELPLSVAERERYYPLCLRAAQGAKRAGDYLSALCYLRTAQRLSQRMVTGNDFMLGLDEAECEFLHGNLSNAQSLCTRLLREPGTLSEKSRAACLSAEIHMRQSDNHLALETALAWLAVFGEHFNRNPEDAEIDAAWLSLRTRIGDSPQAAFSWLPLNNNAETESVLNLMASTIFVSAYDCPQLHLMLVCRMLEMTLDQGMTGASAFGLAWFSVLTGDRYQAWQFSYACGRVARELVEEHNFIRYKARTLLPLDQVGIWTQPLEVAVECARESFRVAVMHGDRSFACLSLRHQIMNTLTRGDHLESVLTSIERGLAFTRKSYYPDVENVLVMQKQLVMQLRNSNGFRAEDRVTSLPLVAGSEPGPISGPKAMVRFWAGLYRGMAHFFAAEYREALRCFEAVRPLISAVPAYIYLMDFHFYSALSLSHQPEAADSNALRGHLDKFADWADLNPGLFADKYALLRAECALLDGNTGEALQQYERAIRLSRQAGYLHIHALANQLAGRCYKALQLDIAADAYIKAATGSWENWGAQAMVRQLEQRYPHLSAPLQNSALATIPFTQDAAFYDMESLLTAVRALTEEINLDRLIHTLMRMLLERAGAQRCRLIRILDGNLPETQAWAESMAEGVRVQIVKEQPLATDLPLSVLSAVIRTGQEIRTGKPEAFSPFSQDPYLVASGAAVLCVPMFRQANMVGVLYLENRLMPDAFTAEHSHIVKTLSAQAAVSLENARLYAELLEENTHRRRVEKQLRASKTSLMLGEKISHTGTWRWEVTEDMMMVSEEYGRILGLPAEQKRLSMADFLTRVHPDDHACISELVTLSVSQGHSMQAEFRVLRPDGECRYIKGIGEPVDNFPEVKEYFGTISDITLQRQAEDTARMAQADLARVTRATTVGQLTASIAHEINQPLMSIVANAGASLRWLKREPLMLENASSSLNEIIKEGKRAGEIIRGLQALTRNHEPSFAPENLHLIARDILALSRIELERRGISLELKFKAARADIFCDRVQIQQVLLNLVINAIDAMSDDLPRAALLRLTSENPTADTLRFEVLDSGCGLPDGVRERIFESFYTTKKSGMGMGLTISKGIIKKHCGELGAENRPEGGSRFWFTLPLE
ncbi:trifunctional serine/threonine-protein kinase/ATP-binding protein/sensor histidine kinase [Pantoea vagans]|uniref:trifunctional serine/threonine-protein kinase/ATP-binding protein/sensor histidine kinase n=1 Tax=Pantoea vagans TaxID=470934 RepID=UPI003AACE695